jgi:hypothetical protein
MDPRSEVVYASKIFKGQVLFINAPNDQTRLRIAQRYKEVSGHGILLIIKVSISNSLDAFFS